MVTVKKYNAVSYSSSKPIVILLKAIEEGTEIQTLGTNQNQEP
jgi:hypothetical protein